MAAFNGLRCNTLVHWAFRAVCVAPVIVACAATPEDPGMCKLSCGKTYLATPEMEIKKMKTDKLLLSCGGTNHTFTHEFKWVVRRKATTTAASSSGSSTKPEGAGSANAEAKTTTESKDGVPVPAISFAPDASLTDFLNKTDPQYTHADNAENDLYKGIMTSSADFCSDSCGMITLRLAFQCKGVNYQGSYVITSGSVGSEPQEITIENTVAPATTGALNMVPTTL